MNTAAMAPVLPQRRVIYSRCTASRLVEVIEQKYPAGFTYLIVVTALWTSAKTIIGPTYSQADAMRAARMELHA